MGLPRIVEQAFPQEYRLTSPTFLWLATISPSSRQFAAVAGLVVRIVAHEFIHGATWAYFGCKPFRSIKFGAQLKTLAPYAHC